MVLFDTYRIFNFTMDFLIAPLTLDLWTINNLMREGKPVIDEVYKNFMSQQTRW